MTLLNTLANLGAKWPNSLALWLLSRWTHSSCIEKSTGGIVDTIPVNDCLNHKLHCADHMGQCKITLDGYTVETFVCIFIGIIWLLLFRGVVLNLQSISHSEWLVTGSSVKVGPNSVVSIPSVKAGKSRYE